MVKKIVLSIIAAAIVLLLLYAIPIRHKINTTYEGLQCRIGDPDYSENVSVTVDGYYYSYLFKADRFEGQIIVDKYDFTQDGYNLIPLRFSTSFAPLTYYKINSGAVFHNSLGSFYCKPVLKQGLICVYEPVNENPNGWNGENGLFISFPAGTRSEAANIARNLTEIHGMTNVDWD